LSQKHRATFSANQVIGPSIYHFGIVDFLQDWTVQKEIERNVKIYVSRKDPDGVSVMAPIPYKLRFQSKMDQIFALDDDPLAPMTNIMPSTDDEDEDLSSHSLQRQSVSNPLLGGSHVVNDEGAAADDSSIILV
jgi:hypothetical protein